MKIEHAESDEQIAATFEVMRQLRPHLVKEEYVPRIRELMSSDGFHLAFLTDEGEVRAVAGYRYMNMLYCGRLLYVDDLCRGRARTVARLWGLSARLAEGRGAPAGLRRAAIDLAP